MSSVYDNDEYFDDEEEEECSTEEEEIPRNMHAFRKHWYGEHEDAIDELYHEFLKLGNKILGGAFYQLGDITHFTRFIFKYTHLGA